MIISQMKKNSRLVVDARQRRERKQQDRQQRIKARPRIVAVEAGDRDDEAAGEQQEAKRSSSPDGHAMSQLPAANARTRTMSP